MEPFTDLRTQTTEQEEKSAIVLMSEIVRCGNPIPPILPRVAYGLSSVATSFSTDVLSNLKNKGFNVVSAEFATTVYAGTGLKPAPDTYSTLESVTNAIELGIRVIPGTYITSTSETLLFENSQQTNSING